MLENIKLHSAYLRKIKYILRQDIIALSPYLLQRMNDFLLNVKALEAKLFEYLSEISRFVVSFDDDHTMLWRWDVFYDWPHSEIQWNILFDILLQILIKYDFIHRS